MQIARISVQNVGKTPRFWPAGAQIPDLPPKNERTISHEMFGLNYIVFRPHNVYGEYQNIADKYRNVVGIFMNQVLQGQPMTIFGNGLQTRAFSYIGDVAPIIAQSPMASEAYNEVFNIGADVPCTVLELAHEVAQTFGVEPQIVHFPPRNEVVHAYASHEKLRSVFSNLPAPTPLHDGIQMMAEWVRQAGARRPIEFDNIEVSENLPTVWRKNQEG